MGDHTHEAAIGEGYVMLCLDEGPRAEMRVAASEATVFLTFPDGLDTGKHTLRAIMYEKDGPPMLVQPTGAPENLGCDASPEACDFMEDTNVFHHAGKWAPPALFATSDTPRLAAAVDAV